MTADGAGAKPEALAQPAPRPRGKRPAGPHQRLMRPGAPRAGLKRLGRGPKRGAGFGCGELVCALLAALVLAAACSPAPQPPAPDAPPEATPQTEAAEPDPVTTDEFWMFLQVRTGETMDFKAISDTDVRLFEFCVPVHEVRSKFTSGPFGEDPVEGLAFELVASDGKVLESAPVYLVEDMPEDVDNDGTPPSLAQLVAVVEHRSDWSAIRFMNGSAVIYETAEPDRRLNKCG